MSGQCKIAQWKPYSRSDSDTVSAPDATMPRVWSSKRTGRCARRTGRWRLAHPIKDREVLDREILDRMHPVSVDRTLAESGHTSHCRSVLASCSHWLLTGHVRSPQQACSVTTENAELDLNGYV